MERTEVKPLCGISSDGDAFGRPGHPTEVLVSFDTEDFTDPRADDAIRELADICTEEGVTAHFEVVGLLAEALERRGRSDVIDAVRRHLVGTHTWSHSVHPDIMEESDIEDFERAYAIVRGHEEKSVATVKRVFGVDRVWCSVPPGNAEPYVSSRVYADMGIHLDFGPTYFGYDAEDLWYAGLRRVPYGYCMEQFHEPDFKFDADAILDLLARKNRFCLFCHPNRVRATRFWDGLNYNGGNSRNFGEWKLSDEYPPEEVASYLAKIREIIRRIKADPRFRFVTARELCAAEKPRVAIVRGDVPVLRAKLLERLGHVDEPASWCVADVFCAAVAFLRGEERFMPVNAYGFLYAPEGVAEATRVTRAELVEAAATMDVSKFLPHKIDIGGRAIGPADFLFAALEVLETGAEEVVVAPREQLGDLNEIPLLKELCYRGTWVHTPELRDDWCSNRMRWQFWTLRRE